MGRQRGRGLAQRAGRRHRRGRHDCDRNREPAQRAGEPRWQHRLGRQRTQQRTRGPGCGDLRTAGTAPTGTSPAHVIVTPDGETVYVTNAGDDTMSVYEADSLELRATIDLSAGPHGLRASPDGSTVVVANTTAGAIDVVDTATNAVAASIPVGDSPPQVAVSADGRYVYVTLIGSSSVVKVDLAEQQVIGSVAVPAPRCSFTSPPTGRGCSRRTKVPTTRPAPR
nr:YncE family protein [Tessaracoccus coleopterorum]